LIRERELPLRSKRLGHGIDDELIDRMMVLHGDLGNPDTLWTAAQTVFADGQGASS
jgi:hypothetical protein